MPFVTEDFVLARVEEAVAMGVSLLHAVKQVQTPGALPMPCPSN